MHLIELPHARPLAIEGHELEVNLYGLSDLACDTVRSLLHVARSKSTNVRDEYNKAVNVLLANGRLDPDSQGPFDHAAATEAKRQSNHAATTAKMRMKNARCISASVAAGLFEVATCGIAAKYVPMPVAVVPILASVGGACYTVVAGIATGAELRTANVHRLLARQFDYLSTSLTRAQPEATLSRVALPPEAAHRIAIGIPKNVGYIVSEVISL